MVEGKVFVVDNKGECSQRHLEESRAGRESRLIYNYLTTWKHTRKDRNSESFSNNYTEETVSHKLSLGSLYPFSSHLKASAPSPSRSSLYRAARRKPTQALKQLQSQESLDTQNVLEPELRS